MTTKDETVIILDLAMNDDGHRGNYMALLNRLYVTQRVPFSWGAALTRQPVLVPLIEESLSKYVAVCLLRSLLGRRQRGRCVPMRPQQQQQLPLVPPHAGAVQRQGTAQRGSGHGAQR